MAIRGYVPEEPAAPSQCEEMCARAGGGVAGQPCGARRQRRVEGARGGVGSARLGDGRRRAGRGVTLGAAFA